MRTFRVATRVAAVSVAVTLLFSPPALAQTGHDLFQQALVKEQAEGDLRAAIALYERIATDFAGDRTLAANALVQMGQCYERLGSEEAERAYRRVVQDYADQTEIVSRARARLAALQQPPEPEGEASIVLRQISPEAGFNEGGPMPDGRRFVYVDYSTGDLVIRDLVTGTDRHLTHEGSWEPPEQYAIYPAVSPDGQQVAYTWSRQDSVIELRVLRLNGSAPRVLCKNSDGVGYPMSWSNDGRHIATMIYHGTDDTGAVAWISVEDGSIQELVQLPEWQWVTPFHSPNDAYVALALSVPADSGSKDIFLVATDGSGTRPLTDHPAEDHPLGWLPGTEEVLFLSDRSGQWDLWALQVRDGQALREPRVVRRATGQVDPLGFTQDGSLFYWIYTNRWSTGLAPFDAATDGLDLSREQPLLGSLVAPSWAPQGRRLALLSDESSEAGRPRFTVAVHDLSTGDRRVLAEHLEPDKPSWFPDGRSILVAARERDRPRGGAALYRVDVATGEAEPLIQVPADPSWWGLGNSFHMGLGGIMAADGETLIYVHNGRLARRDLPSRQEHELYRDPRIATRLLALSPDGTELAFGINDSLDTAWPHPLERLDGPGRLMTVNVYGGEAREVARLDGGGSVRALQWTPDGRSLLFAQNHGDDGSTLWRVPVEGGDPEAVWRTDRELLEVSISPNGDRAAFASPEASFEVWVMENLVEALKTGEGR